MPWKVTLKDNSDAVRSAVESRIQVALEAVGMTCERKAKELAPVELYFINYYKLRLKVVLLYGSISSTN